MPVCALARTRLAKPWKLRCINSLTRHPIVYTDESNGYNHIIRVHATVNHSVHEYACDDDGDGIREVHCNTAEGMWTDVRNDLAPGRKAFARNTWLVTWRFVSFDGI